MTVGRQRSIGKSHERHLKIRDSSPLPAHLVLSLSTMSEEQHLSTRLLHADDEYCDTHVAPYISVSTSESFLKRVHKGAISLPLLDFRYPPQGEKYVNPENEIDVFSPSRHIYARYTQVNSTRVEKVLGDLHVSISGTPHRLSSPDYSFRMGAL